MHSVFSRRALRLAAVAAAFVLPLAAPGRAAADPVATASTFELETVRLVNTERVLLGLPPLTPDQRLFASTEGHASWMAATDTFSHRETDGSGPADRAIAAGYRYTTLGETLARGQTTPEEVVRGRACDAYCITACDATRRCDGWKQSSGHWQILMGAAYRDIGAGYVNGTGARLHWWDVVVANSNLPTVPLEATPGATQITPPPTVVSLTATATVYRKVTATPTRTVRATASRTMPATATRTATGRPSATPTRTPVAPTVTATVYRKVSATPSLTPQRAPTASGTPTSVAPTASRTPGVSRTPTAKPTAPEATPPGHLATIRGRVLFGSTGARGGVVIVLDGAPRAVTDPEGRFQIGGITGGSHVVTARADGALTSRAAVYLAGGEVRDLGDTRLVVGDVVTSDVIDVLDLIVLAEADGRCAGDAGFAPRLDLDASGCSDQGDVGIAVMSYGRTGPTAWSPSP